MMKEILLIGDIHGDWGKLNQLLSKKTPKIILQIGDFGWWPQLEEHTNTPFKRKKEWVLHGVKTNSPLYWCDGNHEEFPYLTQNGKINEMYKNIYHCARGSILDLEDGRRVLFAGGAKSVDKNLRTPGYDWFPEENITNKELDKMLSYGKIHIVVSHTCPNYFSVWSGADYDPNRMALDLVFDKYKPDLWYFGHFHKSKVGKYESTRWQCMNYPGNGGGWWEWLISN